MEGRGGRAGGPARAPLPRHAWRGLKKDGCHVQWEEGPGGRGLLDVALAVLAVLATRIDSIDADAMMVAVIGYLLASDWFDRNRRR